MATHSIAEFVEGDLFEGFYALQELSLQNTSSGKPFIRMTLGDASGSLLANCWDGGKELFATLKAGGVVKAQGVVESYRGAIQMKVGRLRMAGAGEIDPRSFLPVSRFPIADMEKELDGFIAMVDDPDYHALLDAFFGDAELRRAFCEAPAAKGNHHAWIGGLLEHTLSMARYARAFLENSMTTLNRDLLLTGLLLHDVGKIHELTLGAAIEYSDRGKLIGHISIGAQMIAERAARIEGFPEEKLMLAQHMILSHHGKFEYGSPVLPAIPEAFVLNHIDNLDAKTVAVERILREDATAGRWTAKSYMLETALFRQTPPPAAESVPAAVGGKTPPLVKEKPARRAGTPEKNAANNGGGLFAE